MPGKDRPHVVGVCCRHAEGISETGPQLSGRPPPEVSRTSTQSETISQLLQTAEDFRLVQQEVRSLATELEGVRRDFATKRATDQVPARFADFRVVKACQRVSD